MSKEITRRAFLVGGGLTAGALLLSQVSSQGNPINEKQGLWDPIFKIKVDSDTSDLCYQDLANMAKRFDFICDQLPEDKRPFTEEDLYEWEAELLPQYEYNGFVEQTRVPDKVRFALWLDGDSNNHVAGRSDCENFAVVSARYTNPHSSWASKSDAIGILAHELAHVQQGQACDKFSSEQVESTAQVMMLEVLANMANKRNKETIRPVIAELEDMAIGAAWGEAMKEGKEGQYEDMLKNLRPTAIDAQSHKAALRRWENDKYHLADILQKYDKKPLKMISDAMTRSDAMVDDMALVKTKDKVYKLNDLKDFLSNIDEIVGEVKNG